MATGALASNFVSVFADRSGVSERSGRDELPADGIRVNASRSASDEEDDGWWRKERNAEGCGR